MRSLNMLLEGTALAAVEATDVAHRTVTGANRSFTSSCHSFVFLLLVSVRTPNEKS
jgi:hypothetical protein